MLNRAIFGVLIMLISMVTQVLASSSDVVMMEPGHELALDKAYARSRDADAQPLGDLHAMPKFSEERLLNTAEDGGYGYKFANLVELDILTKWFNEHIHPPLPVRVPEFFGISSNRVVAGLREQGFDAAAQWEPVVATVSMDARVDVMRTKLLPDLFWREQQVFSGAIGSAFDRMVQAYEGAPFDAIAHREGADALIADVAQAHDVFMVRSTGKEDTRTMANAGGNESIANVSPEKAALWHAAKEVVLSYFGEKSLKQRLGLGDPSLFSTDVFCPVLVQRMIGERSADSIPTCGVMFTEEPEGGVSWREEIGSDGVIKTTGITTIQAAYGHNEGVVNSKVVVDTVIAQNLPGMIDPVFYPVVRAKRERLVPVPGRPELEMKENPKGHILASALSNDMLITLKKFADALELYYGYPVDVEFVVRDGVVYIVQARPIVHKAGRATPSYLPKLSSMPQETVFKGRTIGAAGGSVVTLANKTQAIMMPTIGGALDTYLKSPMRESIKAVISGTDAPATSHEATTFRSEGKPVGFVRNFHPLVEGFSRDKKLVFSPLQHCVVVVPNAAELEIKEGWCAYPLPPEVSITEALFWGEESVPLPGRVDVATRGEIVAWPVLIDRIKTGNLQQVIAATAQLQGQLARAVEKISASLDKDADLAAQVSDLQRALAIVCRRVVALAGIGPEHPLYVTRLLPVVFLEALVYQQVRSDDVLTPLSIATLINTLQSEAKEPFFGPTSFGSADSKAFFTQLKKISEITFDGQTSGFWSTLTNAVAQARDPRLSMALGKIVAWLQDFDLLPMWLHTTMGQDVQNALHRGALNNKALWTLISGWVKPLDAAEDFLKQIKQLRARVTGFQLNGFDDPKKFTATWAQFKATLLDVVSSAAFKQAFDVSNPTARLAACFMLNEVVDLFDRGIKVVKGSGNYKPKDKAARFKEMLMGYNAFLRRLLTFVPEGTIRYGMATQADFLQLIDNVLAREFTAADFEGTSGFNVSAFTIGSGVEVKTTNPQPTTGEDAFTTIHQDLLVCTSALITLNGGGDIQRPELLVRAERMLVDAGGRAMAGRGGMWMPGGQQGGDRKPALIGCNISTSRIRLHYNLPLNNHSCQFFLDYIHKTKDVQLTVQFYGHGEDRWFRIANFALLLDLADVCRVRDYVITANGCSFVFVLNDRTDLAEVGSVVENMVKHTFGDQLMAERFMPRLRMSWQDAFIAVKRTIGLRHLPHCDWLLNWNQPVNVMNFAEELLPVLQDFVAEHDGKPVATGVFAGPVPGGMINLPDKARELLMNGMAAILQSPEHPSYKMILGALPLYFGKQWYPYDKVGQFRELLVRNDAFLMPRKSTLERHVGSFVERIEGLRYNGGSDKIFYLTDVSTNERGVVTSYQSIIPGALQSWSIAVNVLQLADGESFEFSMTLCKQGDIDLFALVSVLQESIYPDLNVVLKDQVHEIKLTIGAHDIARCDVAILLLQMAMAQKTPDQLLLVQQMYEGLEFEQRKLFLVNALNRNVIAKCAHQFFNMGDASYAWLREAVLAGVRENFEMLPMLVNAAKDCLWNDGVYGMLIPILGEAFALQASKDVAGKAFAGLLGACSNMGNLDKFTQCIESLLPHASVLADNVDISEKTLSALNGNIGQQLQWNKVGRLALIRALTRLAIAVDSERAFACVAVALKKNLQAPDVEQDRIERLQEVMNIVGMPGGVIPGQVMLKAEAKKFIAQIDREILAMPDQPNIRHLKDQAIRRVFDVMSKKEAIVVLRGLLSAPLDHMSDWDMINRAQMIMDVLMNANSLVLRVELEAYLGNLCDRFGVVGNLAFSEQLLRMMFERNRYVQLDLDDVVIKMLTDLAARGPDEASRIFEMCVLNQPMGGTAINRTPRTADILAQYVMRLNIAPEDYHKLISTLLFILRHRLADMEVLQIFILDLLGRIDAAGPMLMHNIHEASQIRDILHAVVKIGETASRLKALGLRLIVEAVRNRMHPHMLPGLVLLMKFHEKDLRADIPDLDTLLRDVVAETKRMGAGPMLDHLIAGFADDVLLQVPNLATYALNIIDELLQEDPGVAVPMMPDMPNQIFMRLLNVWAGGGQVQFLKILLAKIQDAPNPPVFTKTAALLQRIMESGRRDLAQQAATLFKEQPRLAGHKTFVGVKAFADREGL